MKKRFVGIAVLACLLLSSCSGDPAMPVQGSGQDTEGTSATTTTTTEATTTTQPELVYSDDCEADIEYFAISDENRFMTAPIEYDIDGENGVLSADISYDNYADIYTLENCVLNISVTGGEYSVSEDAVNPDGTVDLTKLTEIILTDGEGLHRKYDVVTDRTVYDLPIVNIYLEDSSVGSIGREEHMKMTFFVDASGAGEFSGTDIMTGKIRGRGHSTWNWAKKPYKIKLDEAAPLLGLEKNRDWILLANYSDKSFLRNTVAYTMGKTLEGLDWTPTQYPVDLFVNGEYRGVYTLGEHMEAGDGRVEIDKDSDDVDTGYLLEIGGSDDDDERGVDFFGTTRGLADYIVIKSPEKEEVTAEQMAFIEDYCNKAEDAIVSGEGYEEYIDIDSFCDWIIIHELTYNLDSCFRRSCYITKDKGGKLKMGPIWDFDLAFGNCNADNQSYNDWATVGDSYSYDSTYTVVNWCNYLMDDQNFRSKLRERWFEVRDGLLSAAEDCIDYYGDKIYASQEENFKVWDIWGTRAGYQSWRNADYETYELQLQYLRDFLQMRSAWIDENI